MSNTYVTCTLVSKRTVAAMFFGNGIVLRNDNQHTHSNNLKNISRYLDNSGVTPKIYLRRVSCLQFSTIKKINEKTYDLVSLLFILLPPNCHSNQTIQTFKKHLNYSNWQQ